MLKFGEYVNESLASQIMEPTKGKADKEAKKLGLTYVGYGRYGDSQGNVLYIANGDKLVPYTGQDQVFAAYNKANEVKATDTKNDGKAKALEKQANDYASAFNKRKADDQKAMQNDTQVMAQVDAALKEYYNEAMFDSLEINAVLDFVNNGFDVVNRYLYKGFDETTDPDTANYATTLTDELDSVFENSGAPFSYTVYTCLSPRYNPADMKVGNTYVFRGYVSASLDYNTCIESSQSAGAQSVVLLQIDIAQGQKSFYTEAFTETGELETLLPRGTRIGIVSGPNMIPSDVLGFAGQVTLFYCQIIEET